MKNKLIALLLLVPQIILAHPGHDDDLDGGYSLQHYLTSSYHLSIGVMVIVFVVFAIWFVRRKRQQEKIKTLLKNA